MIQSKYQTLYTAVTGTSGQAYVIAKPNPRRWYLEIRCSAPAGTGGIFPGPFPAGALASPPTVNTLIMKFKDAPSLTTGLWYGLGAPAVFYHVWEDIYVAED